MAEPSGNEIKSGVMILVAAGLLAVLLAAVGPCRALLYEREEVRVVFRDVAGLKPNSPVTYSGVEIGRVKDISIIQLDEGNLARLPELRRHHVFELPIGDLEDADRIYRIDDPEERRSEILKAVRGKTMVELTLELLKIGQFESCRIDDRITVVSTLMGDTAVEISPGSERFCSAGELLIGDAGTLFSDVRDSVNDIRRMMRRADRALGGQKGEFKEAMKSITKATERFAKISENIEGATAEAKDILAENKADIRRTVKDLSAAAAAGRDVLEDGAPRLKKVLASAEKITGTLSSGVTKAAGKLDAALDAARRAAVSAEGLMLGVKPQLRDVLGEAGDVLKRSSRLVDRLAGTVGETRPRAAQRQGRHPERRGDDGAAGAQAVAGAAALEGGRPRPRGALRL